MSEPLLVARDLEREYRVGPETVRVLRGVSMTVNMAESVALIGASGVGKSTLLHLLGGLDRPTSGQVLFAGEDLYARSESALAKLRRTEVASGQRPRSRRSGSVTVWVTGRESCRAASSSAWPSRALWLPSREWCSPTSPRVILIPRRAR